MINIKFYSYKIYFLKIIIMLDNVKMLKYLWKIKNMKIYRC